MPLDIYPLAEAAQQIGRDPSTVSRWVRKHRIPTRTVGSSVCIDEKGLERLRAINSTRPRYIPPSIVPA